MALTYTPGGEDDNSYAELEEANAYFEDRLNTTEWEAASDTNKQRALVTATQRIDEEQFFGGKTNSGQALKWPRTGVLDEDGNEFDPATIPERVKQAVYITALELLRADFLAENYMGNFSYFSAGSVQIKQFTQTSAGRLPADAQRLLRHVMTSTGGGRVVRA